MEGTRRSQRKMAAAAAVAAAAAAAAAAAVAQEEEGFSDEGGGIEDYDWDGYGDYSDLYDGDPGNPLDFHSMGEAKLRQWVEANPGRVNDRDKHGETPLYVAARRLVGSLSLTVWLLDEKGANVHATESTGETALHFASTLDILNALLDRGAHPGRLNSNGKSPVACQVGKRRVDNVARLLQDPRARATVNVQDNRGYTVLHHACELGDETLVFSVVKLLLQAGANPYIRDNYDESPWNALNQDYPRFHSVVALFEQVRGGAENATLLAKARRLVVAANSDSVACRYTRYLAGRPLPQVSLTPVEEDEDEESCELHTLVAFTLGMEGGPENTGMPRDVFQVVLDLLLPTWDLLRRRECGIGSLIDG